LSIKEKLQKGKVKFTVKGYTTYGQNDQGKWVDNIPKVFEVSQNGESIYSDWYDSNHNYMSHMFVNKWSPTCVTLYTFDLLGNKTTGKIKYKDVTIIEKRVKLEILGFELSRNWSITVFDVDQQDIEEFGDNWDFDEIESEYSVYFEWGMLDDPILPEGYIFVCQHIHRGIELDISGISVEFTIYEYAVSGGSLKNSLFVLDEKEQIVDLTKDQHNQIVEEGLINKIGDSYSYGAFTDSEWDELTEDEDYFIEQYLPPQL
tara:strand:- start:778 stop:1557 length:780 start_codon:yes stop_codon:yes gene_type:complete